MAETFTPEQRRELDERANTRDLDRGRSSIFSDGERIELDARDEIRGFTHFTAGQRQELDELAELRDLRRPRRSTFSIGEQKELDNTAQALRDEVDLTAQDLRAENINRAEKLQFNELQKADLAHRFNKVKQTELVFRFRHRFLPYVVSGVLIAVGIVDLLVVHHNSQPSNKAAIAAFCHQHHLGNC